MVFLHTPDNARKLVPHEFSQSPLLLLYEFYEIFCAHLFFKINNVSSTNSEQCKLCIDSPLYIDTRLLWKQTIGSNGP